MDNTSVRLAMAVDQADTAILITDVSGIVQYANAAFERDSGYSPTEVIGQHVRILKSGKHDATFYRRLWETLSDGRAWRGVFVNKRKDGRLYEDETLIWPVRDGAGAVVSYAAFKRDVTAARQREMECRHASTMDAVGRFAGGVAHDFNNALMTIMGHTEMLEYRLSVTGAPHEELAEIKAACDRAASLTRQLLAFGRRQVREPVVVDVNRLVEGLGKMLRRLLGEHVALNVVSSPHPALVRFEMGQLEQIVMTLAIRAREAMPAGGAFTITVDTPTSCAATGDTAPASEGWVEVRVSDTGPWIEADARVRMFEPFSSGKPQSWEQGLGLAAGREMIRQCGGRIAVSSVPGEGTTFRISLPCVAPEDASLPSLAREPLRLQGTETILLAEDEDAVRDLVRMGLRRLGYRVLDAPDGATAMARAAAHGGPIDLLMTDMVMPGMSGRELADRLVAMHPQAKVIYMSGYPDETLGDQGVWEGSKAFLQKPFTPEVVARAVRRALTGC